MSLLGAVYHNQQQFFFGSAGGGVVSQKKENPTACSHTAIPKNPHIPTFELL